jgi:CheY-like chemotaxis protein
MRVLRVPPMVVCGDSVENKFVMTEHATRPVILLVDDNPHDVVLIRLAFRKVGIIDTIQLVKDGNEALRYLKGEGQYGDRQHYPMPTLVLLDLKMPQANGFEVLEWAREQIHLTDMRIVVMSGSKNDSDISKATEMGANAYLVKPTKFEDLVKMMESIKEVGPWKKTGGRSTGSLAGDTNLLHRAASVFA